VPELSVVIPTYDTAAMTLRCCAAVLASMPPASEVVVVDDGSSDGTSDLLGTEVPQVRVIRRARNGGFAAAANEGVAAASGRVILLLNSDAIAGPGAIQALLAAFDDPKTGIAAAQLINEDGSLQWSGGRTPTLPWMIGVVSGAGHLARLLRRRSRRVDGEVDWVSGAAMAFRREVWNAAGPLNERYLFYCQDLEFSLRARRAGWRVRVVDQARVQHGLGRTIARGENRNHDPERLWADLLTWGRSYYGPRWASVARLVLLGVGWVRVLAPGRKRDALRRAVRRLAQSSS
jgi:GT2 family glycosyltransferase